MSSAIKEKEGRDAERESGAGRKEWYLYIHTKVAQQGIKCWNTFR